MTVCRRNKVIKPMLVRKFNTFMSAEGVEGKGIYMD